RVSAAYAYWYGRTAPQPSIPMDEARTSSLARMTSSHPSGDDEEIRAEGSPTRRVRLRCRIVRTQTFEIERLAFETHATITACRVAREPLPNGTATPSRPTSPPVVR